MLRSNRGRDTGRHAGGAVGSWSHSLPSHRDFSRIAVLRGQTEPVLASLLRGRCNTGQSLVKYGTCAAGPDQITFFRSLIFTASRQNPATCGTNQGNRTRRFAPPLRADSAAVAASQGAGDSGGAGTHPPP